MPTAWDDLPIAHDETDLMRIAYLDCFAGISGDMMLGALVDAGVPKSVLDDAAIALGLDASLRIEKVDRSGISATKIDVLEGDKLAESLPDISSSPARQDAPEPQTSGSVQQPQGPGHMHPHSTQCGTFLDQDAQQGNLHSVHGRSLTGIRQLIEASSLADKVKALALRTFELLGQSEAKIHNVPVEEIHFHEVGAVDAIVDIVAACAGIVHLGVDAWYCSPVNVGAGIVRCAHGLFPVPAPATADLLRGTPTYSAHLEKELTTPTGAALLCAIQPTYGQQPVMALEHIGYGAGTRNPAGFPNVLRLSIGESYEGAATTKDGVGATDRRDSHSSAKSVTVLETALDDATPQVLAYVAEQAMRMGALDVMLTPVLMKKGRPGTMLTLLARPEDAETFEALILRETTSLGLRIRQDQRVCLDRQHVTVTTPYGDVRIKTGLLNGKIVNAAPEFEDCRRAAEETATPLKQVQAAAVAAYVADSNGGLWPGAPISPDHNETASKQSVPEKRGTV